VLSFPLIEKKGRTYDLYQVSAVSL